MARIIGIDLGTTSVRGVACDEHGEILAGAERAVATSIPRSGWSEQDPDAWLLAVREVLAACGPYDALAICGQINTHVLVDGAGNSLGPAITWADIRAADVTREFPAWAPSTAQARYLWLQRHEPERLARARWIMLPKDFVNFKLTGAVASDYLSNRGMVSGERYRDDMPEGLSRLLPELVPIDTIIQHAPVVSVGTMDSVASFYGSGSLQLGTKFNVSGTSDVVGTVAGTSDPIPGFRLVFPVETGFLQGGPSSSGGAVFEWLMRTFFLGSDHAAMERMAAGSSHPNPPIFLPYLNGERAPLWNSSLRSAWLNLSSDHAIEDLARGALEGLAFAVQLLLDALCKGFPGGDPQGPLILSGGGSKNRLLNALKATVSGRHTIRTLDPHTGVRGAAMLAYAAGDPATELATAIGLLASRTEAVADRPDEAAALRRRYLLFRSALNDLEGWHEHLARTGPGHG